MFPDACVDDDNAYYDVAQASCPLTCGLCVPGEAADAASFGDAEGHAVAAAAAAAAADSDGPYAPNRLFLVWLCASFLAGVAARYVDGERTTAGPLWLCRAVPGQLFLWPAAYRLCWRRPSPWATTARALDSHALTQCPGVGSAASWPPPQSLW